MKEIVGTFWRRNEFAKPLVLFVLVLSMALALCGCVGDQGDDVDSTTKPTSQNSNVNIVVDDTKEINLGNGLIITNIGKYAGIYMEDGSDEIVTGLLMIIVKNENEQDLQLARIEMTYSNFTAEFEITNLPSGKSIVLLERNRHEYVDEENPVASVKNVAFFPEKMSLCQEQVELSGSKGSISIKNLTQNTLGEIYIYYKNSSTDLLYGGITYRAKVGAGLEPDATTSVMTGHYNPNTSTIVNVQILPVTTD